MTTQRKASVRFLTATARGRLENALYPEHTVDLRYIQATDTFPLFLRLQPSNVEETVSNSLSGCISLCMIDDISIF